METVSSILIAILMDKYIKFRMIKQFSSDFGGYCLLHSAYFSKDALNYSVTNASEIFLTNT